MPTNSGLDEHFAQRIKDQGCRNITGTGAYMFDRFSRKSAPGTADLADIVVDPDWYRSQYPDISENNLDPVAHFRRNGLAEGRDPSLLFSTAYYLDTNPDIAASGVSAAQHFFAAGGLEGRSPHPLFDARWYLAAYPDVPSAGLNPLVHFLTSGSREGRNPHPLFDTKWYLAQCPQAADHKMGALGHYLTVGAKLGISPHPLFDPDHFATFVPSSDQDGFNPLVHYILSGPMSDAPPHPLFAQKWYRERTVGQDAFTKTPLEHFITTGSKEMRDPHPLFQSFWYHKNYLATDDNDGIPIVHFLTEGANSGTCPNPYFLTRWYKNKYLKQENNQNRNPLLHYMEASSKICQQLLDKVEITQFVNPNPWFDTAYYLADNSDILSSEHGPLAHYIEAGAAEDRSPCEHFAANWYRNTFDIGSMSPLEHFLESGLLERNAPNPLIDSVHDKTLKGMELEPKLGADGKTLIDRRQYEAIANSDLFDADWYRAQYLQQDDGTFDPAEHYLIYGAHLGYNPSPKFNSRGYRTVNHDLRDASINPLLHYIKHGQFEGRHASVDEKPNQVTQFRFSQPEYGPVTDILAYDSDVQPPSTLKESICVHLHLYYADMAEEFCHLLNRLTVPFTLLISVQPDQDEAEWTQYFIDRVTFAQTVAVKACPNRGRDVSPWLVSFRDEIGAHDIFCHLHTKKSGYNKFQKSWRRYLAHTAFGSRTTVNQTLSIFADNPDVGLVYPAYFYILRNQPNYGKNYDSYERLYMMLFGDLPEEECPDYPAGSFFWARSAMLKPLFDLGLSIEDFDEEAGQIDGTIAHALERILGALPNFTGHSKRCIAIDVPFDLTRYVHPARVESFNTETILPPVDWSQTEKAPSLIKKSKIAAYTAITGGYENLVKPLHIDPEIDYFVVTDTPEKFSPDWATVITSPFVAHRPVRTARYAKTHPHFWFPDYDYAIWMDANVLPVTSLLPIVERINGNAMDAAFIEHPLRFNCMEEGQALVDAGLDDREIIEGQMTRYGKIPKIFSVPLIETNLFICRPQLEVTHKFFATWWSEMNNWSHRDQLSIGYALLESGLSWMSLFDDNVSIRDNPNFYLLEHEMHNRAEFVEKINRAIRFRETLQEAS